MYCFTIDVYNWTFDSSKVYVKKITFVNRSFPAAWLLFQVFVFSMFIYPNERIYIFSLVAVVSYIVVGVGHTSDMYITEPNLIH